MQDKIKGEMARHRAKPKSKTEREKNHAEKDNQK